MNDIIQYIPLDSLEPCPGNRQVGGFDQAKLEQLAESIKAVGVQQPAVVRPHPAGPTNEPCMAQYQLVAGERRWRASKLAGMETLPCIVRELDDVTALKIQYIENLQRDDVHPLDEADGYEQLIAHAGYTVEVLASEVGKSASYIYQRMKLSSLTKEARDLFIKNKITAGHAILLARLQHDKQKEIIEDNLFEYDNNPVSVRELSNYIQNRVMLDMSSITWKLDDAELDPAAGSCRDCPKRTGYQPALFADVCKNNKKDYCSDGACFHRKQERIVELKREQLKGEDVVEVVDGYTRDSIPDTVKQNYQWHECKKSEKGAKKVLVVAGDKPGRVTYGIIAKDQKYSESKEMLAYKERQKKEAAARKSADEKNMLKVKAVLQAAADQGSVLPLEALRLCVARIWDRWWNEHVVEIARAEGWVGKNRTDAEKEGLKRIKEMDEAQLSRMLLWFAMVGEVKTGSYCTPSSKTIDAIMGIYGVKVEKPAAAKKKGVK